MRCAAHSELQHDMVALLQDASSDGVNVTQRFTLSCKGFAARGECLEVCRLLAVVTLASVFPLFDVLTQIVQDLILGCKQLLGPGTTWLTSFAGSRH